MYICGWYEVKTVTDDLTGRDGFAYGETFSSYEQSISTVMSTLASHAKTHCDAALPGPDNESDRANHIGRWTSHVTTMRMNQMSNHQQISAPNGYIYWWLKLV